jgi:hypothetical protein
MVKRTVAQMLLAAKEAWSRGLRLFSKQFLWALQ